jgi:hypothetical protein
MEKGKKYRIELKDYYFVGTYLGPCPKTLGMLDFNLWPAYHRIRVPSVAIIGWTLVDTTAPNEEPTKYI